MASVTFTLNYTNNQLVKITDQLGYTGFVYDGEGNAIPITRLVFYKQRFLEWNRDLYRQKKVAEMDTKTQALIDADTELQTFSIT